MQPKLFPKTLLPKIVATSLAFLNPGVATAQEVTPVKKIEQLKSEIYLQQPNWGLPITLNNSPKTEIIISPYAQATLKIFDYSITESGDLLSKATGQTIQINADQYSSIEILDEKGSGDILLLCRRNSTSGVSPILVKLQTAKVVEISQTKMESLKKVCQ